MKYEEPKNPNYAATIIRVRNLIDLEGLDNLKGLPVFGLQALVGKDTPMDELMVMFPAESQLSLEFAYENNLHRHGDLNKDESAKGYLEDSRRVKALKLRGHRSDALVMPLTSLLYAFPPKERAAALGAFAEGDTFDVLNGKEIVRKYYIKQPGTNRAVDRNAVKKFRRVDEKFLPEHFDTENYWRNAHHIPGDAPVVVTQKLHGTSIRLGRTIVKRQLSWLERLAKRLGVKVAETEYDNVYGSRKVIKDPNNPDQQHFYGDDIWTAAGKRYDDLIPDNFVVYGELVGYTFDGAPIQKNYTYDLAPGENELYIYRVAVVTNGGMLVDLSWDQVKHFAADRGLKTVPEFWRGRHDELTVEDYLDTRYADVTPGGVAVPLSHKGTVDEGICVRTDIGRAPYILKAKSPIFLQHETKMLDQEAVDIEAEGADTDAAA